MFLLRGFVQSVEKLVALGYGYLQALFGLLARLAFSDEPFAAPVRQNASILSVMSHPLDGIWAKLVRAEEHLDTLDVELEAYWDSDPGKVVRQFDPDDAMVTILSLKSRSPPLRLSIIIGDCIHNLRSCLDHLAWQLVLAGGSIPTTRTAFPIFKDAGDYEREVRNGRTAHRVPERALALIETLQPYHRRDDPTIHPLWVLRELSNIDKHRSLHLTAFYLIDSRLRLIDRHGTTRVDVGNLPPLYDGAPIAILQGRLDPKMKVNFSGTTLVAFEEIATPGGPGGLRPAILIIEDLLKFVRNNVIPQFEPFFD